MNPPMVGSWVVRVLAVKPFTIHGDLYFELQVMRVGEGETSGAVVRVPQHAIADMPVSGEVLTLTFLMGQVTSAQREATPGA